MKPTMRTAPTDRSKRRGGGPGSAGACLLLAAAGSVAAQETGQAPAAAWEAAPREEGPAGWTFDFLGEVEHRIETDIDRGGSFERTSAGMGLLGRSSLTDELQLAIGGNYRYDYYEFSTDTFLVAPGTGVPWKDVHTVGVAAVLRWSDADRIIWGGPLAQTSAESEKIFDGDTWIYGGFAAMSFQVNPDLRVGGGVGVVSQIEDSSRVFPVIDVDWVITDEIRLSTQSGAGGLTRTGAELSFKLTDEWETAVGVAYEFRRFRLDNDGTAPDGVGEDTSLPLWWRLSYRPAPDVSIDFRAGIATAGNYTVEDQDGNELAEEDYQEAGIFALSVSVRF